MVPARHPAVDHLRALAIHRRQHLHHRPILRPLDSLIRFPIRYRDYLLIRLSFGLMDPPTLAGIACLSP
jgi:hypothetical protein